MLAGSIRLAVFTPLVAPMPTISEVSTRANFAPSPPFGPVLSQMPKTRPVGHTLNNGPALRALASVNDLPSSDIRNRVLLPFSLTKLSRNSASATRCGAVRDVTLPTSGATSDKSTSITGSVSFFSIHELAAPPPSDSPGSAPSREVRKEPSLRLCDVPRRHTSLQAASRCRPLNATVGKPCRRGLPPAAARRGPGSRLLLLPLL